MKFHLCSYTQPLPRTSSYRPPPLINHQMVVFIQNLSSPKANHPDLSYLQHLNTSHQPNLTLNYQALTNKYPK